MISKRSLMDRMLVLLAVVAGCVFAPLCTTAVRAADDLVYSSIGAWNGKKVYLSPARHTDAGSRGECTSAMGGYNENTAAYRFAWYAASGDYVGASTSTSPGRNLRVRGYRVRIGRGTLNSAIANSNAWGANAHVPIHSNARSETCSNTAASSHGTVVIFKSYGASAGEGLAGRIKDAIGPSSPGTNDFVCHNSSSCTSISCLGELCQTNARAAYLEREFHTWNAGAAWMAKDHENSWRLGMAIDQYFGYP